MYLFVLLLLCDLIILDNEEIVKPIAKKRNRLAIVNSDSDSDTSTAKHNPSTRKTKKSSDSSEDDEAGSEDVERKKPASKRRRVVVDSDSESDTSPVNGKSHKGSSKNKSTSEESLKGLKSYSFAKSNGDENKENVGEKGYVIPKTKNVTSSQGSDVPTTDGGNWLHNKLDFLKPERIRDINKNRPDHPDYDEKTLHVPEEFLNKQTPAMRQWWILKSKHLDSVLFFKVGKFYELYHMDAVIGCNNLGFSYMRVCCLLIFFLFCNFKYL